MKIVAIDTCVLSDLVEGEHAVLRHRLVADVRAGNLIIPVTQGLQWEVPAVREKNDAKYRAIVDLLWTVSREGHVLMNVPARCERELRLARALRHDEIFEAERGLPPVIDPMYVDARAKEGAAMARALLEQEEGRLKTAVTFMDEVVRQRYGREIAPGAETSIWRRALRDAKRLRSRVVPFAEGLVRAAQKKTADQLHISIPDVAPDSLPTFWTHALIYAARVRDVAVLGQLPSSRKAVDQLDVVHLQEAAAYADVFVTSDRRLRLFAARVQALPCRVLSLQGWRPEVIT